MCGRTRVSMSHAEVSATAGIPESQWRDQDRYHPTYNASPGTDLPVIVTSKSGDWKLHTMRHPPFPPVEADVEGSLTSHTLTTIGLVKILLRQMRCFANPHVRWGLVPSFSNPSFRPDYYRMMNARSETVAEKQVFKRLLNSNRCLVPINAFYEWRQELGAKHPYHVSLSNHTMFIAGLYDCWASDGNDGSLLFTFTLLTTDACPRLRWLHSRMPVILRTPEERNAWLCGIEDTNASVSSLFTPYNGDDLTWYPVTQAMNKPSYQGAETCKEVKIARISSFLTKTPESEPGTSAGIASESKGELPARATPKAIHSASAAHQDNDKLRSSERSKRPTRSSTPGRGKNTSTKKSKSNTQGPRQTGISAFFKAK